MGVTLATVRGLALGLPAHGEPYVRLTGPHNDRGPLRQIDPPGPQVALGCVQHREDILRSRRQGTQELPAH